MSAAFENAETKSSDHFKAFVV